MVHSRNKVFNWDLVKLSPFLQKDAKKTAISTKPNNTANRIPGTVYLIQAKEFDS
jgi:hypothetical protein